MVLAKVRASTEPIRLVVCDLSTSANIDLAGARMLARPQAQLQAAGIAMRIASAHALARDILRREGLEERVGYLGRRVTAMDVVDEFEGAAWAPSPASAAVAMKVPSAVSAGDPPVIRRAP